MGADCLLGAHFGLLIGAAKTRIGKETSLVANNFARPAAADAAA